MIGTIKKLKAQANINYTLHIDSKKVQKRLFDENNELQNEVEYLKRNIKITKINEYEVENRHLCEHALRMDQVLQQLKR